MHQPPTDGELFVLAREAFRNPPQSYYDWVDQMLTRRRFDARPPDRQARPFPGRTMRTVEVADEPVRIVRADPDWPRRFVQERALLEATIGEWAVGGIHHVGSTAVPSLDAKPIIDILVGVPDLDISRECFEPLGKLDYRYAPYRTSEMHWFCKPNPSRRTHHLHLVPVGSDRYRDELAFRDYLRGHPQSAAEYAVLKRELAMRFAQDREAYTEAKSDFVRATLAKALRA
jgi:GrpB-like predicted nucleotidyltransferase (UPF0157 family)